MSTVLVVTYLDGGRRFFPLGHKQGGWRFSQEDGMLVIGKALRRTMVPMAVIRHIDFERHLEPVPDVAKEEVEETEEAAVPAAGGDAPVPIPRFGLLVLDPKENMPNTESWWSGHSFYVRFGSEFGWLTAEQIKARWLHRLEQAGGGFFAGSPPELHYRVDDNATVVAIGTAMRRDQLSGENPIRQPRVLRAWWSLPELFCVRLDGTIACSKLTVEELRQIWRRELESHGGQITLRSYGTFLYRLEESENTIMSVITGRAEQDPGAKQQ